MSAILPVNLDDLLHCRRVESARVEFKTGWDPNTTGFQALRTICAFANDYHNLNGGYEGRLTGLAKIFRAMEQNGSPPPRFDFDVQRTCSGPCCRSTRAVRRRARACR